MSPWDIPVFRSAYFPKRVHRTLFSKTHDLQVRFAHPPNCAPSYRFFVLFSKTHDLQVRFAHPPNCAPSYRFFVLFRSAYFPSPHRIGFSSCSGVPHGLFCAEVPPGLLLQNAHAPGSLRSPSELRTALPFLCAFPVGLFSVSAPNQLFKLLRCSAWLIQLRQRTALSPLKRSCFSRFAHPPNPAPSSRLFSISRRSGLMAPLCKGSCPASSRTEGLPPG